MQVWQPLYGCDCYAYGLLAAGFCDLVVEADLKPYDYMAQVPIIEGAGGVITDWQVCHPPPPHFSMPISADMTNHRQGTRHSLPRSKRTVALQRTSHMWPIFSMRHFLQTASQFCRQPAACQIWGNVSPPFI